MSSPAGGKFQPQFFFVALAAGAMAYLTLVPLIMLIYGSVKSGPPGASGDFTIKNYLALFENWRLAGALVNSLIFSAGSSILA
ncbi:MAG TPA: hypothetical protein VKR81_12820, partial [Candidatus Binatia bacterium]|nr:hypothetical protein [Candidatus Binatia bacterium]